MTALKIVQGQIVGSKEFEDLDKKITEVIRDFVQLGELLIKMRDGQSYRSAGYTTFEDYCKSKAGLSISDAKRKVRYAYIVRAITDSGAQCWAPEIASQVAALEPIANFNTEKRKVQKADGSDTYVEQTVGIKNPAKVAEQWGKTVREFERLKAKAEKEGTRPPTLSGTFIRNHLPNEVKVSPDRFFACNPLVAFTSRLEKMNEHMEQCGFTKSAKLRKLAEAKPPCLPPQVVHLKDAANAAVVALNAMLDLLEGMDCE